MDNGSRPINVDNVHAGTALFVLKYTRCVFLVMFITSKTVLIYRVKLFTDIFLFLDKFIFKFKGY